MRRTWIERLRSDWLAALALFASVGLVYMLSSVVTSYDSRYALQISASILDGEAGELTGYRPLIESYRPNGTLTYQVVEVDGRLFSFFPIGTPLLATPLVLAADLLAPGTRALLRDRHMQELEQDFASLFAALGPALLFLALRRRGFSLETSLVAGLTLALSTSMWSIASRALWQHGPLVLAYAGLLWALATPRPRPSLWLLAGCCAGLGYLIRPVAVAAILPFGVLALTQGWRQTLAFGCGTALGVGLSVAYNLHAFGSIVPLYANTWSAEPRFTEVAEILAGLLFSPSRGLLIFSPVLIFAALGLWRAVRRRWLQPVDRAALAALLLHFAIFSLWWDWKGGHTYGPRLATDLLPFLIWFLCFALRETHRLPRARRLPLWGSFVLLFVMGAVIHGHGATDNDVWEWNVHPVNVDLDPARVWDWSDAQFLRGW